MDENKVAQQSNELLEYRMSRFYKMVATVQEDHPDWRLGQSMINTLCLFWPEIYRDFMAQEKYVLAQEDPFYVDENVPNFIAWLREYWK